MRTYYATDDSLEAKGPRQGRQPAHLDYPTCWPSVTTAAWEDRNSGKWNHSNRLPHVTHANAATDLTNAPLRRKADYVTQSYGRASNQMHHVHASVTTANLLASSEYK